MAETIKRIEYFYAIVEDKPGEARKLLEFCSAHSVNLINFTAFPVGEKLSQLDFVPEDAEVLKTAAQEAGIDLYGPKKADTTFVAWGSSYGPVREAVDKINENGEKANLIHFTDMWPFPEDKVLPILESAKRLVNVESNGTAQFASLLRGQTGRKVDHNILRYDGRPLSPDYILARLK